ncbi:NADPH-dependent cytochrome P450 oxidoreductase [Calocera viscosa TUFC12733]|uniref:NADPH--cytochrome P450 reductase n=1 Tax=Calocera viscosa (strain TUFC12733) TaxID=1330018 RepID=A0A167RWK5_CALVF|nr:NADPH-dependent cytochrome P450 oxidoreductase [Calocera viscosa TUFC12733]
MASVSTSDLVLVSLGLVIAALWFLRDSLPFFKSSSPSGKPALNGKAPNGTAKGATGGGNPRDFVAKMKDTKKRLVIFYGSQTGTAEEYAIRLAKEAKARFGLSSLVCDPEEYDFDNLDQTPEDCAAIFVVATYGEGEPTDNAVTLMENLEDESFEFSGGEHKLENLRYVVFGLGNRTYEHYNEIARKVDAALEKAGATRIGQRGEGDDDKSMEEDYLEWKDGMWEDFARVMNVEEGAGSDTADFVVTELDKEFAQDKVYLGELSARALTRTKGIHDAKNPYPAPIKEARELFAVGGDRNCIHVEFDIEGSGLTYQHGDHVGVWPTNPDVEVDRLLCVLGLGAPDRRNAVIGIESLDPTLAKVPFPVPTTYQTVLRHYIDISATAGRQSLSALAKHAPTPEAAERLQQLSSDKTLYAEVVGEGSLKLGEVLQLVSSPIPPDFSAAPTTENVTPWSIPFDLIVSLIPRLQPRYYSISSSPKLHPGAIHITAVVLKYQASKSHHPERDPKWVFGVGTNYILNLKLAHNGETSPLMAEMGVEEIVESVSLPPRYAIEGPRSAYFHEKVYRVPIHVRRSTFRLPTNPKTPVIMIGPGTGVAPFRGFVQERVALAKRAIEKNGPDALVDWGNIWLFYGCRSSKGDFLYADEWPYYADQLKGKFLMHTAFSRETPRKPDGGKVYVQDLIWQQKDLLTKAILEQKAYIYICGDAKGMAHDVEEKLMQMLGEGKGGSAEVEGAAELKLLKERSRLLLDVWS